MKGMKGKIEKTDWPLIAIGIVVGLVLMGIIPSPTIPSPSVECPAGKHCYNTDQTVYLGTSLNYIPQGNYGGRACLSANPGYSKCYIVEICPNCVDNKVACGCQK